MWRDAHGDPLKDIRSYRNRLVHGRVVPQWDAKVFGQGTGHYFGQQRMYPRLEFVDNHLDWRRAADPTHGTLETLLPEFEKANVIVRDAWKRVLNYAETS